MSLIAFRNALFGYGRDSFVGDLDNESFSFSVSVCFTCNYIIGTGFLTIPFAFHSSGWLLSAMVLIGLGFLSIMSIAMILEAMARAGIVNRLRNEPYTNSGNSAIGSSRNNSNEKDVVKMNNYSAVSTDDNSISNSLNNSNHSSNNDDNILQTKSQSQNQETDSISRSGSVASDGQSSRRSSTRRSIPTMEPFDIDNREPLVVEEQKYELTELCEMYIGTHFRSFYAIIIAVYMYGCLWVFSAVFSKALAYHITIDEDVHMSYSLYLFLFGCIVIPASCMELKEQVIVQVTLAALRVLVISLMIFTILPSFWNTHDKNGFSNKPFWDEEEGQLNDVGKTEPFVISNAHHIFTIGAYAFIFHHSIPALSQPVGNKKSLLAIFSTTILFCLAAYVLLGVLLSMYFGNELEQSANLNWSSYVDIHHHVPRATLLREVIGGFIVLFPALDVASAFPLNAITLGNSLMSAYYGPTLYRSFCKDRFKVAIFRILSATPPIIAAACVHDLGSLTAWTGLTGLIIIFIIPPILCIASSEIVKDAGYSDITHYSSLLTSRVAIYATLFAGGSLICYCCYCLATVPPKENV